MSGIESKTGTVERDLPQTEEAMMTTQQFTRSLYRLNHIMAHMGLGANVNTTIGQLQRMVFMARMAEMSFHFLMKATPYGWLMGALGFISIGVTFAEQGAEVTSRG